VKVLDINGQEISKGGMVLLLCEVLDLEPGCVRIRVMNSEMQLGVGTHHDEVLGGTVADSELTAFFPDQNQDQQPGGPESDGVAVSRFE